MLIDYSWPLDLQGCQLTDGGAQSWFVDGALVVEPGTWLVFAGSADPAGDGSVAGPPASAARPARPTTTAA